MKRQSKPIVLASVVMLIGVSPMVGGVDTASPGSGTPDQADPPAAIVAESTTPIQELADADTQRSTADQSRIEDTRGNRNGPHPAVLSHEHPVYPIGVPNPPVSLERY